MTSRYAVTCHTEHRRAPSTYCPTLSTRATPACCSSVTCGTIWPHESASLKSPHPCTHATSSALPGNSACSSRIPTCTKPTNDAHSAFVYSSPPVAFALHCCSHGHSTSRSTGVTSTTTVAARSRASLSVYDGSTTRLRQVSVGRPRSLCAFRLV
jgi:hypothetical protein